MGFGIPQYGNTDAVYWKNFKLRSPDASKNEMIFELIVRILPPMHSLAEKGKWAMYYGQHFGYAGNGKDPGKAKQRPFGCIEQSDFRTKMITVACPACDVIAEKKADREAREAEYKAKKLGEGEIRDLLDPLTQWLKKHNCDRKWHINVMNQAGEFGVLTISHTVKKMLDVKMEELRKNKKIDPMLLDQGVWFRFTRMGKFPVQDAVEVVTESFDVKDVGQVERVLKAPLTEAQQEQALKVCPDLAKDVVKFISGKQIAQLVASSGDPDEVDRIWQIGTKTTERTPARTPAASTTQTDSGAEMARLKAELAALKAGTSATADPAVSDKAGVVADSSGASEDEDENLSDEDFVAKYTKR